MEVKLRLKQILQERGISQRELSRQTGILYPTINKMCNNTLKHMPLDSLALICTVLDCKISDLLKLEKEL